MKYERWPANKSFRQNSVPIINFCNGRIGMDMLTIKTEEVGGMERFQKEKGKKGMLIKLGDMAEVKRLGS